MNKTDKQKTTQVYNVQCDAVFGEMVQTNDEFKYGLAVGIKNDNFPFMQYIIDIYMRKALQYVLADLDHRDLIDYCFDRFFKQYVINSGIKDERIIHHVIGAIDFYLRLCPPIHVTKPLTVVNDDIKWIIEYIVIANEVINDILENDDNTMRSTPFQLDLIIACNSMERVRTMHYPELGAYDDDDDESGEHRAFGDLKEDVLGDIHHKLIANKLRNINVYTQAIRRPIDLNALENIDDFEKTKLIELCYKMFKIDKETDIEKLLGKTPKAFAGIVRNNNGEQSKWHELCDFYGKLCVLGLRNTLDKIYGKDFKVENVILFEIINYSLDIVDYALDIKQDFARMLDMNMNMDHFEYNKKLILDGYHLFAQQFERDRTNKGSFPFKQRMCMFVDRRSNNFEQQKDKNKHSYCDDIIFYEYPEGANKLPQKASNKILPEAFHNLSQKCMIPRVGYEDDVNETLRAINHRNSTDRMRNSTITCMSRPGGNVLIFSFHVIKKDIVKCYLWRNAQFIRFFNSDIVNILPFIFNKEFGNNQKFMDHNLNRDKLYSYIHSLTFEDKIFNGWCNNRSK